MTVLSDVIVPGRGIGIFQVGWTHDMLLACLPHPYRIRPNRSYRLIETAELWFYIDDDTNRVEQITALGHYKGKVHGQIGINSTLADVARVLGPYVPHEDGYIVPTLPGVSFELDLHACFVHKLPPHAAPIAFISVW